MVGLVIGLNLAHGTVTAPPAYILSPHGYFATSSSAVGSSATAVS